jgi:hypothetical protein
MNPASRAAAVLADPSAAWQQIATESGDPAYLLSRYVAYLALVPAICGFIGACVLGAVVPGIGTVRVPLLDGVFGAVFGYVATTGTVIALGLIVNALAPWFGGARNFDNAFKLAVYSYTPVWLAGIFLLLPGLRFLILTGFYGAYILWLGLPPLVKTSGPKQKIFALTIVGCAFALTLIAAAAQRAMFSSPGL